MNTKKIIKEAAYRLFESRPIERIAVEDILKEAEVSRSTFYKHFENKYELMHAYFEDLVTKDVYDPGRVPENMTEERWRRTCRAFLRVVCSRRNYYDNVKGEQSQFSFMAFVHRFIFEAYRGMRLKRTGKASLEETERMTIEAFSAAYAFIVKAMLERRTALDEEQAVDVLQAVIPEDYRSY